MMPSKVLEQLRFCSSDFLEKKKKETTLTYRLTISIFLYTIADPRKHLTLNVQYSTKYAFVLFCLHLCLFIYFVEICRCEGTFLTQIWPFTSQKYWMFSIAITSHCWASGNSQLAAEKSCSQYSLVCFSSRYNGFLQTETRCSSLALKSLSNCNRQSWAEVFFYF